MSLEPEEVKRAMKKTTEIMWGIREALGFPVLRRPLLQLREQMKIMPQIRPEIQGELQPPSATPQVEGREEGDRTLASPVPLRLEMPTLPLPTGLKDRIERFRAMPIRRGIAEVLNSYSRYISSPRQRKRVEEEEAYEERVREPSDSKLAEARLKRKGVYKGHSLEM